MTPISSIRWRILIPLAVLIGLAARVAWVAAHAETGWETIAGDWQAAFVGQFFGYRVPLPQRTLLEQDEFWRKEVERILGSPTPNSDLLQGAIRILSVHTSADELPTPELVEAPGVRSGKGSRSTSLDKWQMINRQRRALQHRAGDQLTQHFPKLPAAWQTRGEFYRDFCPPDYESPNPPNWRTILETCQAHDPENSLYEFSYAQRLLTEARELEYANQNNRTPDDLRRQLELENSALAHIRRGLELSNYERTNARKAVLALIDQTNLTRRENPQIARHDFTVPQVSSIAYQLDELIERVRTRDASANTRPLHELKMRMLNLREGSDTSFFDRFSAARSRAEQWRQWANYLDAPFDSPDAAEAQQARAKAAEFEIQARRQMQATTTWNRQNPMPAEDSWFGYAAWRAAQFTALLLIVAALCYGVRRVVLRFWNEAEILVDVRFGVWRHLLSWLLAVAMTTAVLGLAPAEIISHSAQGWLALGLFLVVMVSIPIAVALWSGGRFSLRTLMYLVILYGFIFTGLTICNLFSGYRLLGKFPPEVWIPADGNVGVGLEQFLAGLGSGGVQVSAAQSSAYQWILYRGAKWTVVVGVAIIGLWSLVRARRAWQRTTQPDLGANIRRRALMAASLRCIAQSAGWSAIIALAFYLAFVPTRIEGIEASYQSATLQARQPEKFWAGMQQLDDELAADSKYMQQLRQQVESELGIQSTSAGEPE